MTILDLVEMDIPFYTVSRERYNIEWKIIGDVAIRKNHEGRDYAYFVAERKDGQRVPHFIYIDMMKDFQWFTSPTIPKKVNGKTTFEVH